MEMQCKGCTIHYELSGSGARRVALLHGWGCSGSLMQPIADGLSADCTVLTLDFPGHGASGRPPEPWGVPEYAEALMELFRALDFVPCDVIAHSFGGRVAIWLAAGENSPFDRMILTGAAGLKKPQTEEGRRRAEAYRKGKRLNEKLRKVPALQGVADRMEERLRRKFGSRDYNALDAEMRRTFVKVIEQDLSECLPAIHSSTLLIWGSQDTETPLWMGQKMEREIPDAGLVVLEGGTHFAYLEQAPRFIAITRNFLLGE